MNGSSFLISKEQQLQLCKEIIAELINFGLQQIGRQNITDSSDCMGEKAYCVGSTLHRGACYPSPVYDLIVGNTKRGRIVRQTKNGTKITHRYLYDQDNKLYQIESIYRERIAYTETLFRYQDEILGVTVDKCGCLAAVTRETYQDHRLCSFVLLNCYDIGEGSKCYSYQQEDYDYDADGLCGCRFIMLMPESNQLVDHYYEFERQDGYLTAYTERTDEHRKAVSMRHPISKKRKA